MKGSAKIVHEGFRWGALYLPERVEEVEGDPLRVAVFGSTHAGQLVLGHLLKYQEQYPGEIRLTGVATDDPLAPGTRISVAKRIWGKFRQEEMEAMRDGMIGDTLEAGLECYTGAVKTDAFWEIFRRWDPQMIIMCCFGQKIDKRMFSYPLFGMYNFHPSDLAEQIGVGPQPFEHTLKMRQTISRMVIHSVNETIDCGPLIAISPPVNICMPDGSYPFSILTLQEKIPAVSGWMSIELLLEVIARRRRGLEGPVDYFDMEKRIPQEIRGLMMQPAVPDLKEPYLLPLHYLLNKENHG